jgi:hypothetical protein
MFYRSRFALALFIVVGALPLRAQASPPASPTGQEMAKPMYVCSSTHTPEMGPCSAPPRLVSSPDPKYPEGARKANYGDAQVVLWLVVTEEGKPSKIR